MTAPGPGGKVTPESNDRLAVIEAGLVTLAFFALVAFTQWVTFAVMGVGFVGREASFSEAVATLGISLVPSGAVIVLFAWVGGTRWGLGRRAVALLVFPLLGSAGRLAGLRLHWGEELSGLPAVAELANGLVAPLLALVIGLYYVDAQERARRIQRLIAQRELEAQRALGDLQAEELRVRQEVSHALHGRIQQRLVFIAARLAAIVPWAERDDDASKATELRELVEEVDELRETAVRELSHHLYPTGLDIGLHAAIQLYLARLPAAIAVTHEVSDAAAEVDDVTNPQLSTADRFLLVSVLEEGVTNAVKHGRATQVHVGLDLAEVEDAPALVVEVRDNGLTEVGSEISPLSSLARLRARMESRGGGLALVRSEHDDGATLRFWLPRPLTD
ncbi:MAG: hypothetical protein FWD59_00185 [Micrococcales bacterium]|nr:hypothetical protein [Micrococcales bacterium]